jgi:hypothetical protein
MVAPLIIAALTPFVKDLFANGLSMLGNAVLSKGKAAVEEKLGVKLPEEGKPLSPEQLVEMRNLQFEHEEKLLELGIEKAKVELELEKVDSENLKTEVADRTSARDRDAKLLALGQHNFRADVMFVLAVLVIVALVWMIWRDPSVNEFMKGIVTLVLGRFLGYLDSIYNFEFGTTRGSRSKDTTIESLTKGGK